MNFIDIILIALLFVGVFRGMKNGLFVEFASLISLVVGIYIALKFGYIMQKYLGNHFSKDPKITAIIAFAITFVIVVVGIQLLAKFFTTIANFSGIGFLNNIGGGMLAFVRTAIVLSIFIHVFEMLNKSGTFVKKEKLEQSKIYYPLRATTTLIYPSLQDWYEQQTTNIILTP